MNSYNDNDILYIALTFDIDSDFFDSSMKNGILFSKDNLFWLGIEKGIPLIGGVLQNYVDDFGSRPKSTWFVRVDSQLAEVYGDSCYLLENYGLLWQQCMNKGDEIGWHPHLYRLDDGKWHQETNDVLLTEALRDTYGKIKQKGLMPISTRVGEGFCSNAVLKTLDELGIRCDSTAMPGRVRKDKDRHIDWEITPQGPYHPSRIDYRRSGQESLNLLEIPMSMVETKADYDKLPLRRYVDLSFYHEAIKDGLRSYIKEARLIVTITHPSAILAGLTNVSHGLLAFEIKEFQKNLEFIFSECKRLGKKFKFITIRECWPLFADKIQS